MGATNNGLRVIQLEVSAFKGIRAVCIKPDGQPVVEIAGRNGAGKSSVLDALLTVFSKGGPDKPIRNGYKAAEIEVDVGEYRAMVRITPSGKKIEVIAKDGKAIASPAAFLASQVGQLWADPLEFTHLPPREQVKVLQRVTGLDERFAEIEDRKKKALEDLRTAEASEKFLTTQYASMQDPGPGPETETPATDVMARLEAAQLTLNRRAKATTYLSDLDLMRSAAERLVRDLETQLKDARDRLGGVMAEYQSEKFKAAQELVTPPAPDIAALQRELAGLATHNETVRTRAAYRNIKGKLAAAQEERKNCMRAVEAVDADRTLAMESARLPIPGLTFTEDGLFLDGVPFSQANTAAQLRVGVAIALANNPKLRVVLVRNGSVLDSAGLKTLHEIMVEHGAQAIVERVTDGDGHPGSFVIEAGELVGGVA